MTKFVADLYSLYTSCQENLQNSQSTKTILNIP